MFNHALIMAAGRGMRMMPLTAAIPKPMAYFKGSTLIGNAIAKIHHIIPSIHITVGYKAADLARHVIENGGVNSIFHTEGRGIAWWIFNTLMKKVDEPVLVLTCDNVVELDLDLIYRDYEKFNQPACMVVPVKPVEGLDGDFIFHENNRIVELNRNKPSDIYCSGIQVLNPNRINSMVAKDTEDFYVVWQTLIARQQLYSATAYPKKWFAVDTIEQLNKINEADF
jgi:NDP-sugar pyrophosphorylase family protein